jgi:KaiC/GvpD/RAD55 family RecA-like ATPase
MLDEDDFGGVPAPRELPSNVIPFPAMRANAKLSEAWSAEVAVRNKKNQTRHELLSPLDVLPSLIRVRSLPPMPWPPAWPDLANRVRIYPGQCLGVVGAIGGGKTSLAIQICLAAAGCGVPILWAPLELSREELLTRIVANMFGVHMMVVRDQWPEQRIAHALAASADMWHFVDRYDDPAQQIQAIDDAAGIVEQIYRVKPLVVVDHMGQLVAEERDARTAMMRAGRKFEAMTMRREMYTILLAQGARSTQALLTGKVEVESASDALGAAAESSIMEAVCASCITLAVFKENDAESLDGQAHVGKARSTGREGTVGMRFSKPGGVWHELGHLPPTPAAVKAAEDAEKKDKNRTSPPRSQREIRAEINAGRAGDADAARRADLLAALRKAGSEGCEVGTLRLLPGTGRSASIHQALQELERANLAERMPTGRWRAVVRT